VLMMFSDVIHVYCKSNVKHTNTLHRQNINCRFYVCRPFVHFIFFILSMYFNIKWSSGEKYKVIGSTVHAVRFISFVLYVEYFL
jgi:hypothetical protein